MSLTTQTMSVASMKKVLGIAHTDDNKGPGNEAFRTGFSVSGSTVFGGDVPSTPTKNALYDLTGSVEFVRLKMVLDPTSNGFAYTAQLPNDYQTASSNPNKAKSYFANNERLVDSAGKLQIIPASFGPLYEAIPYSGGTSAKGSGTLIPPASARDWIIDPFNGVIFQQQTGTSIDYLECYIWVGDFVTDQLAALTVSANNAFVEGSTLIPAINQYYVVDTVHSVNPDLNVIQWFISTFNAGSAQTTEVTAMKSGTAVTNNKFSNLLIGSNLLDVQVDLDSTTHDLRLLAKPTVAGITVEIKRLVVI